MKSRLAQLTRDREHMVAVIDAQRREVQRAFTSLRRPLHGVDRVRQATRYVVGHRTSIWAVFTLLSLMRRMRSRRKSRLTRRWFGK